MNVEVLKHIYSALIEEERINHSVLLFTIFESWIANL